MLLLAATACINSYFYLFMKFSVSLRRGCYLLMEVVSKFLAATTKHLSVDQLFPLNCEFEISIVEHFKDFLSILLLAMRN